MGTHKGNVEVVFCARYALDPATRERGSGPTGRLKHKVSERWGIALRNRNTVWVDIKYEGPSSMCAEGAEKKSLVSPRNVLKPLIFS